MRGEVGLNVSETGVVAYININANIKRSTEKTHHCSLKPRSSQAA